MYAIRSYYAVGSLGTQVLKRVVRVSEQDFSEEDLLDCRFVPLVGKFGWGEEKTG